jgi:hypothetical protein
MTTFRMASSPILTFWMLAIVASPLYLLNSGLPQPADILFAVTMALALTAYFMPMRLDTSLVLIAALWLGDVWITNMVWWLVAGQDTRFLLSSVYYLFDVMLMCVVASLMAGAPDRFIRITRGALLVTVALEVASTLLLPGGYRSFGTFNNPNQLGYWALLTVACWFALKPREHLAWLDAAMVAGMLALCVASGSRAALIGAAMMLVVTTFFHGIRRKHAPVIIVVALAGAIALTAAYDLWRPDLSDHAAVERFGANRPNDTLASRGYDRLWLFPQYLIFGAGEGAYTRFEDVSAGGSIEIHSTWATVLFGYGLLGASLFACLIWWVVRGAEMRHLAYAVPLVFYGVTHQGLREGMLWVFLGLILGLKLLRRQIGTASSINATVSPRSREILAR